MAGPGRAPGTVPMIRCWLKLLKDLPRQSHHDAIIFLIISGHLSLALILQLPGTAGGLPGPVPDSSAAGRAVTQLLGLAGLLVDSAPTGPLSPWGPVDCTFTGALICRAPGPPGRVWAGPCSGAP